MGKERDERLQRYFDGELAAEERTGFAAELSEEETFKLAALGELRGLIGDALRAEASEIDLVPALMPLIAPAAAGKMAAPAKTAPRRARLGHHLGRWSAGLMMAAALLLMVFQPWHPRHAGNACDIEELETWGTMATVFHMSDAPHRGDATTTVIWTEED